MQYVNKRPVYAYKVLRNANSLREKKLKVVHALLNCNCCLMDLSSISSWAFLKKNRFAARIKCKFKRNEMECNRRLRKMIFIHVKKKRKSTKMKLFPISSWFLGESGCLKFFLTKLRKSKCNLWAGTYLQR